MGLGPEDRIDQLMAASREVLVDCVFPNGAVVAANSDRPDYPSSAVNYRYVWGRDAAFTLRALDEFGMASDRAIRFARWLMDRCEGFAATGTLIKRYATNGSHDRRYGTEYQPDQAGALMTTFGDLGICDNPAVAMAVGRMADGLSHQWRETHFEHPIDPQGTIQDLWEDQHIRPGEKAAFTYTLATAVSGLRVAICHLRSPKDEWLEAVESLSNRLQSACNSPHYIWKTSDSPVLDERRLDASLIGAIWPFGPFSAREQDRQTVRVLYEGLYRRQPDLPHGMMRYPGDVYDGINTEPRAHDRAAGSWPLLSFWQAITLNEVGDTARAHQVYGEAIEQIEGLHIPEQSLAPLYAGQGPQPLAWGHAMLVLATGKLGLR